MPLDNSKWHGVVAIALLVFGLMGLSAPARAQSDIRATLHNLSKTFKGSTDPRTVKATTETQVCVFCHTPHNANTSVNAPLWNRTVSATTNTYTRYSSSSLDANTIANGFNAQPGGSSLLCLSCHDGVIALGNVNVLPRNTGTAVSATSITLSGSITTMPAGTGATTGYTRLIGTDLTNDHPISISYTNDLATADGELRPLGTDQSFTAASSTVIGVRSRGFKPLLPLEPTGNNGQGQVQCATCHDPHITKEKFLRLNRFQTAAPSTNGFDKNNDQICLACHPKLAATWAESAHALSSVADETYAAAATTLRGFPSGKKVWEVACLNCHDTHTVQGSRRLLREGAGTSSTAVGTGAGSYQPGFTNTQLDKVSAIENTCYQCHSSSANRILSGTATGTVPDIRTEFQKTIRMPIDTFSQNSGSASNTNTSENHDIRNANFVECRKLLGNTTGSEPSGDHLTSAQKTACDSLTGSNDKRHVECTDCHNPHRVRRNSKFYGTSTDGNKDKRTHDLGNALGNVASGVLRGAWGVEPVYTRSLSATYTTSGSWTQMPDSYEVKKGDPTGVTSYDRAVNVSYLTREYQLCMKCHSSYAIGGNATTSTTDFPLLGNTRGGTGTGTNGMTRYTNVAAEFGSVKATDPPTTGTDQGEKNNSGTACGGGDCNPTASPPGGGNNHRSWHPVMFPTGRDRAERKLDATGAINLRAPFDVNVGVQTMHCSDCHGDPGSWTQNTGPSTSVTQGPHGSTKDFLLKGDWNLPATGAGQTPSSPGVCGNCHNPTVGSGSNGAAGKSGFSNPSTSSNLWRASHGADVKQNKPCNYCHIAVPHGWKNKAFLVNLECVGPENGETSGFDASGCKSKATFYTAQPYYRNAVLKINTWASSGNWSASNCGPPSGTTGKDWMTNTCDGTGN